MTIYFAGSITGGRDAQPIYEQIIAEYERDGNAYASTSRIWDDGILDPVNTRKTLALALAMALENAPTPKTQYGVFRM